MFDGAEGRGGGSGVTGGGRMQSSCGTWEEEWGVASGRGPGSVDK